MPLMAPQGSGLRNGLTPLAGMGGGAGGRATLLTDPLEEEELRAVAARGRSPLFGNYKKKYTSAPRYLGSYALMVLGTRSQSHSRQLALCAIRVSSVVPGRLSRVGLCCVR